MSKLVPRLIQTQPRISYQLDRTLDSWLGKHCRSDAKRVGHILQNLRCSFCSSDVACTRCRQLCVSQEPKSTRGESVTTCGQIRAQPLGRSYCSDTSKLVKCTTSNWSVKFQMSLHAATSKRIAYCAASTKLHQFQIKTGEPDALRACFWRAWR